MAAKSFLVVSRAFYPGYSPRANRATELAKELCRQGKQVSVLTPFHPAQVVLSDEFGMQFIDLGRARWPEILFVWRGKPNLLLRAIRRLLWKFLMYPEIEITFKIIQSWQKISHHDCIISIAAPHSVHWGVAWCLRSKKKNSSPVWIADCGDPFMGQENDTFTPAFYFRWLEKGFCSRADWITVPTVGAKGGYYSEFQQKLKVIPQGFRFEDYKSLSSVPQVKDGVIRFAFAGLLMQGIRDPRKLLDYLISIEGSFEFHLYTSSRTLVEPYAVNDKRIILHSVIPRIDVLSKLAAMDFLVNIENAGQKQSPSKLIDYLLCGRPILSINSFDFDPAVVLQFLHRNYERALKIDDPAKYRIENVVNEFVALAESD